MPVTSEEVRALGEEGFVIRADAWPAGLLRRAAAEAREASLRPAGVTRDAKLQRDERGDDIGWIDPAPDTALGELSGGFEALRLEVNEAAWLGLARFDLQLARYGGGGARYVRHRDAFPGEDNRRLTAIVYLNEGWVPSHGGVLRLFTARGEVDVQPALGTMVIFLSERIEHEVLPTFAERFALTAWYYGR